MIGGDKIVLFKDGTIGLIEKTTEEYSAAVDGFLLFHLIRFADGHQAKMSRREINGLVLIASDIAEKIGMELKTGASQFKNFSE